MTTKRCRSSSDVSDERAVPVPERREKRRTSTPVEPVVVNVEDVLTTSKMLHSTRPFADAAKVPSNKVGSVELYKRFPVEYDLLMSRHDCCLLSKLLMTTVVQKLANTLSLHCNNASGGLRIADLGCGTGRMMCMILEGCCQDRIPCSLLCGYDKECSMLKVAMRNVLELSQKCGNSNCNIHPLDRASDFVEDSNPTSVSVCLRPFNFDHISSGALSHPHPKVHMVLCAWSLSFVMRAQWGGDRWHDTLRKTIHAMLDAVVDGGCIVIIETLGNGCETPTRRNTMLEFLEQEFGFERSWVRTDYTFQSMDEGKALCNFFFAGGVAEAFVARGALVLPECTGVWVKWVQHRHHADPADAAGGGCTLPDVSDVTETTQ